MLGFYCVNDGKDIEGEGLQIIRCIFCHNNFVNAPNPKLKKENV